MTEKTRIEIALLLPTVPDARDACVQRLGDLLKANDGIESAHFPDTNGKTLAQICIHYDPNRLSIREVRDLAHRAGAELEKRFGRGVKATVDGQPVHIGKESLFAEVEGVPLPDALHASVEKLKASGRTTMIVRRGDTYLGVLALMDTPRAAAKDVIAR